MRNSLHVAVGVDVGEVIGERRADGEEAGDLAALLERLDHLVEIHVREPVAVVGEEDLLVLDVVAHRPQPLADVAPDAGVDERDAPILLDLAKELDVRAVARRRRSRRRSAACS